MRSRFVLLIYVFGLMAAVMADNAALKGSKRTSPDSSLATVQHEDTTRLLEATTDLEERAGMPGTVNEILVFVMKQFAEEIKNNIKARYWLWTKKSAEDIFKRHKLDEKLENIVENPKFHALLVYIRLLNRKNPNNKVSVVELLTNTYGDLAVVKEIQAASFKMSPNIRVAWAMVKGLRRNWKDAGKSADDIFTMLELHKLGGDMFVSMELITWYTYVVMIKKESLSTELASVLMNHYSVAALSKMFKEVGPLTPVARFITVRLETAVAKAQFLKKTSLTRELFKLLDLDTDVNGLLTSPNLSTFIKLLMKLNEKVPGRPITQIETFTHFFGDQALASMLEAAKKVKELEKTAKLYQAAQFRQWLRGGKTPLDVRKILKLEEATPTTNPDAEKVWRGYTAYCKLHNKS